jgi:hypothetical protein
LGFAVALNFSASSALQSSDAVTVLQNESNPYKYNMWQALLNFPVTAITVDDKFIWAAVGGEVKILDKTVGICFALL